MIAIRFDLPKDFAFWQNIDEVMLRGCEKMFIADMPNWSISNGIGMEKTFCELNGIPYEVIPVDDILKGEG